MEPTVEIDTTAINAAMREMVQRTKISRETWMRVEGAAVVDKCITWTKMATIKDTNAASAKQARYVTNREGDRIAWLTHTGIIWVYSKKSNRYLKAGTFEPKTNQGGLNPWAYGERRKLGQSLITEARNALQRAKSLTKDNAVAAKKARGLAVQSWVQIADANRLPIKETKKVATARAARATTGIFYRNGFSSIITTDNKWNIQMVNQLPYNKKIGMAGMFERAMKTRVTYFQQNLRRGVFNDMSAVAARYPGLRAAP